MLFSFLPKKSGQLIKLLDDLAEFLGKKAKGKTFKFEVETLDRSRRYDIQFEEFLPDGRVITQNLELKNWTGFWDETIKSQFTKDLDKMKDLGDTKWIFNKKGINQSMDELRQNVIKNLKKADGSPIDELNIIDDYKKVQKLFPDDLSIDESNYLQKLLENLDKPEVFKQIFEIVE